MIFRGVLAVLSLVVLSPFRGYCVPSTDLVKDGDLPTIRLDNGTFTGNRTGNVTQFLSIPYALPPYISIVLFRIP